MVNDRAGYGDFFTPERSLAPITSAAGYMVEACQSIAAGAWGYQKDAELYSTPHLLHSMLRTVTAGGNYLLNVGPKPDGTLPEDWVDRLSDIGHWLKVNEKAVYGAEGCPQQHESDTMLYTRQGKRLYLHMLQWPDSDRIKLLKLRRPPLKARLLGARDRLKVAVDGDDITISGLPSLPPDPSANTIELLFDAEDMFRPEPELQPEPPATIEWNGAEPLYLLTGDASLSGFGIKGSLLSLQDTVDDEGETWQTVSTSWQPEQTATWHISSEGPAFCRIFVELSCPQVYAGGVLSVTAGGEEAHRRYPGHGIRELIHPRRSRPHQPARRGMDTHHQAAITQYRLLLRPHPSRRAQTDCPIDPRIQQSTGLTPTGYR